MIAPACLEAGNGGCGGYGAPVVDVGVGEEGSSEKKANFKKKKGGGGVTECRICQEEGEESEMEAPCACNGTLKVYSPDYSLPQKRASSDAMAIDIRSKRPWKPLDFTLELVVSQLQNFWGINASPAVLRPVMEYEDMMLEKADLIDGT
ncbi:putative E3 ubiquitin-protein ligase MARCH6 [Cocos nucifera]|nr:putative E3 ubiquitin-protein ligase MARCH6 [Cocos nucifera]